MKTAFAFIVLIALLFGAVANTAFSETFKRKPVATATPAEKNASTFSGDWIHTGTSIRVKTIVFVDVKVYEIRHYMKQTLPAKSKQAVIEMDADKKFEWKMMRDVDKEKIQNALKDAFAMNGYADAGKIGAFMGAFTGELKENSQVSIVYDSQKKATTITVGGGSSATVQGVDFMKGVWSIWFGKIDQSKLGDQLISKI